MWFLKLFVLLSIFFITTIYIKHDKIYEIVRGIQFISSQHFKSISYKIRINLESFQMEYDILVYLPKVSSIQSLIDYLSS